MFYRSAWTFCSFLLHSHVGHNDEAVPFEAGLLFCLLEVSLRNSRTHTHTHGRNRTTILYTSLMCLMLSSSPTHRLNSDGEIVFFPSLHDRPGGPSLDLSATLREITGRGDQKEAECVMRTSDKEVPGDPFLGYGTIEGGPDASCKSSFPMLGDGLFYQHLQQVTN